MAYSKTLPFLSTLLFLLLLEPHRSTANRPVVKAIYWFPESGVPASSINSNLFTHLFCAFADLNLTTYQATISAANAPQFSTFTQTVRKKNRSVKTLLSIGGGASNASAFADMASQPSRRQSFINSSISLARSNNFDGLDLDWEFPATAAELANFGALLTEWRAAVAAESRASGRPALLLSAAVFRSSNYYTLDLPVQSLKDSLDWINVMAYDFYAPPWFPNFTAPPAGLYNITPGQVSVNAGIREWIQSGFPAWKIVLGLPFYGYSWRLVSPSNNGLFAPANGAAISPPVGDVGYGQIRSFVGQNSARCVFNSAVVTDYCYANTTWIGYDDVRSVSAKVVYAKRRRLLGYFAWHVGADSNWTLSRTAFRTWDA